ncbi:hypothetical protein ACFL5V_10915, partial [Fibrobacterota bacterium]
ESSEETQLEVLTDFAIAINEKKFERALRLLSREDRKMLLGFDRKITRSLKARLSALDLQKLTRYRNLTVRDGKISGLVEYLPEIGGQSG